MVTEKAIPPALAAAVGELAAGLDAVAPAQVARVLAAGAPWLAADPSAAELGAALADPRRPVELRVLGCAWLARFPGVDTAKRLAALALDAGAPVPVRERAIAALGDRAVRDGHAATRWPADALQIADDALFKLADAMTAAGKLASEALPIALRAVASEASAAVIARAPGLWGAAIECFATPALGRVLYVSLDDIPPAHRVRALRLLAATLGDDALPLLRARATRGHADERLEARLLAVAVGGEAERGPLDDVLIAIASSELLAALRGRARWHVAHRGVVPMVRALRIARTTATLAATARAAACATGADDLAAIAEFARHDEPYVYDDWAWLVYGAGDPARAATLVAAHPEALADARAPARVRAPIDALYLEHLARRGRVAALTAAAQELGAADRGALLLATYGRPLAALELAATAREHTPELAAARALACVRAARPDLAARIVADDLPPAEVVAGELAAFPGANERWLIANAPATCPATAALAGGLPGVIALAQPAPDGAERDAVSLAPLAEIARRLARTLRGATVYVAGEIAPGVRARLDAAGARVVTGPLPGTDFYVAGDAWPADAIAQLERAGARRLLRDELLGLAP